MQKVRCTQKKKKTIGGSVDVEVEVEVELELAGIYDSFGFNVLKYLLTGARAHTICCQFRGHPSSIHPSYIQISYIHTVRKYLLRYLAYYEYE